MSQNSSISASLSATSSSSSTPSSHSNSNSNNNNSNTNTCTYPNPITSFASVLHFLQAEWRRFERERNDWEIERADLRVSNCSTNRLRLFEACLPLVFLHFTLCFITRLCSDVSIRVACNTFVIVFVLQYIELSLCLILK